MDWISDLSLEVTGWLQGNYPQLKSFFGFFSAIGEFEIYLVVITLVYWCLNKRLGATLIYLLTLSGAVNSLLKHALRDPRPYWTSPEVGLSQENTYGVPSGHAQNATVFYGTIALWFRTGWVWLLAVLMILIMALSRIYLGVHDIEDVLAGIIVGVLILAAYVLWGKYGEPWFNKRILGQRLLIAISLPLFLAACYIPFILLTDPPGSESALYELSNNAEANSYENSALTITGLFGLSIGFVLEGSRVRFLVGGPFWKRALRYILGVSVALLLWQGLGYIFPDEPLGLELALSVLRFLLLVIWIAYYGPLIFTRLKLAESAPQPKSSISP